ncbi:hypothetical protein LCGC14_1194440 [marine sediment metagenome]|uniref:Uncharacterized protein n=1 Tax=marine sediment metagenome TaxID=412755 RepID=A0A0F9LN67_9ZZZZ
MLFDKETKYWQEEYRKGNLDDVDMFGETRALLDGTAERIGKSTRKFFLWAMIPTIMMFVLGFIKNSAPTTYERLQNVLTSYGAGLGTGLDPAPFLILGVTAVIAVLNIFLEIYRERSK